MFQIVPAFAVPFADVMLPGMDALNTELRTLFLAREAEGAKWRNPSPSMKVDPALFESDFNLFAWPDACVQQLREACIAALSRLIAQLNGYGKAEMDRLQIHSHTWFHVTRPGGYFGLHNHPMASWSGVYCVDPGDNTGTREDSGVLHFANPLQLANMFVDPANSHLRNPYAMGGRSFPLKAGQLVLFPSWVNHEVLPYTGRGERITVAFNTWYAMAGAEASRPYG
jgi:uncharacterized protein (TIGR02466 family)